MTNLAIAYKNLQSTHRYLCVDMDEASRNYDLYKKHLKEAEVKFLEINRRIMGADAQLNEVQKAYLRTIAADMLKTKRMREDLDRKIEVIETQISMIEQKIRIAAGRTC